MAPPDNDTIAQLLSLHRPQTLAALLRTFRDLDLALAAWQDAAMRARLLWPGTGLPGDPLAWLVACGRNAGMAPVRHQSSAYSDPDLVADSMDALPGLQRNLDFVPFRDDTLRLLYICANPGLPPSYQIALLLHTVCGLTVAQLAHAFLLRQPAMEQRIARAKRRVAETGTSFDEPAAHERAARLKTVLAMVYLLFSEGYASSSGRQYIRMELCEEAIRLARLLARMFPHDGGALGLAALLMLQHARSGARVDAKGALILLDDQDRRRWDLALIDEALPMVDTALHCRELTPYQIQAAVAAVHAQAETASGTDWAEIDRLYAVLQVVHPSPIVTLNRAVAVNKLRGPTAALVMIEPLAAELSGYAYYFSVRGMLLKRLGRNTDAQAAMLRARELVNSAPVASHIDMTLNLL
ncbi:RNA polymerase sigma factor [Pseudoduganella aquatica]|uniref:RNA polymerase sigma factor n=1 Tax=Pseudoduganella aquatica TaxID=2660641 RepID=UPI003530A53E